ncbi:MAG TPA: hypothetical protein VGD60_11855 [Candidatus Acidoferrales bacterium]
MSVRLRVLLIVCVTAVGIVCMLYAASQFLSLDRFRGLEDLQAKSAAAFQRTERQSDGDHGFG